MLKVYPIIAALLLVGFASRSSAHYLWLERDGEGPVRAYYGEWVDDIREKTGGLLDRFQTPRVFLGASSEPLPVKRNENNLEFATTGAGDVRLLESGVPPRDDSEKGGTTKTIYYAKHGRSETASKLNLELVPTETNGKTFVLMLFGAPLPKAELTIIGPSKWEKPLTTDERGRVTLPMPWMGRYVLEVIYFDEKAGVSGEQKFSRTRHISSLSFVQSDGIRWTDKP